MHRFLCHIQLILAATIIPSVTARLSTVDSLHLKRQGNPTGSPKIVKILQKSYQLEDGFKQLQPPESSNDRSLIDSIPWILQPWDYIYRKLPLFYLPRTNMDITFTLGSATLFTCFDYTTAFLLRKWSDWPMKESRIVAGSITTIFHSSMLVPALAACLLSSHRYQPSGLLDEHPKWWRDVTTALLQFCTGYMLYDAVVQFIADRWSPGAGFVFTSADYLFLGHHLATFMYMTSTRLIKAGHMSAMALMFLGEFTAPIMNLLRISQAALNVDPLSDSWLAKAHPNIEYIFAAFYVPIRAFIGPLCAIHLAYDLLLTKEGRKNVPIQLSFVWLTLCWGVIFGSIPWIENALRILRGRGAPIV